MAQITWKQGEHIALVGDTGTGKSYLLERLFHYRQYCIMLQILPDDANPFRGFRHVDSARKIDAEPTQAEAKYVLTTGSDRRVQRLEAYRTLRKVFAQGGWCLGLDELWYLSRKLRLEDETDTLLTNGRKRKISVVCGMQRPANISRFALAECTHLFAFRCDGRDAKTLRETFTDALKPYFDKLGEYEFVYYHRPTKTILIGNARRLAHIWGAPPK